MNNNSLLFWQQNQTIMRPSFIFLVIALMLFAIESIYTQQLPLFSLNRDQLPIINPAIVSNEFLLNYRRYKFQAGLTHRTSNIGNIGQIMTQSVSLEYIATNKGSFAPIIGLNLVNDRIDPTKITGIYGKLGNIWGFKFPNSGVISAALSGGLVEYRINASELQFLEAGDTFGEENIRQYYPDVGLGIFYYQQLGSQFSKDGMFYLGFSVPQILGLDLTISNQDKTYTIDRVRHYYGVGGYYHFLDAYSFVEASALIRYIPSLPISVDVIFRYQKDRLFWIGMGGTYSGLLTAEAGGFVMGSNTRSRQGILKVGAGFSYPILGQRNIFDRSFNVNLSFIPYFK